MSLPAGYRLSMSGTAVACLILVFAGCRPSARSVAATAASAAVRPNGPPAKHALDMLGKVNGKGWYLPWYVRDPKKPKGPPIPVLTADAETGEITRHNGQPVMVMQHVKARLFQKGILAANVEANEVRANQQDKKVYAVGECRVVSLSQPSEMKLTADRIIWDITRSRVVADGHAHASRKPRNGGLVVTQDGGTIIYDMEHDTVSVL